MTDDLVKRLRDFEQWMRDPEAQKFTLTSDLFDEAADRIEQLEAALRHWACACTTVDHCKWSQINCPHFIARAVLRGEKI